MEKDKIRWMQECSKLQTCHDDIDFQTEFIADLSKDTGYSPDAVKAGELLHTWEDDKVENILTYRDQCFASVYTGTTAPKPTVPWWEAKDDSIKAFIN